MAPCKPSANRCRAKTKTSNYKRVCKLCKSKGSRFCFRHTEELRKGEIVNEIVAENILEDVNESLTPELKAEIENIPSAVGKLNKIISGLPKSEQVIIRKLTSPRKSIARKISLSEGQILKKQKALSELKRNVLFKAQARQKLKNKGVFDELQEKVLEKKHRALSKLLKERQASQQRHALSAEKRQLSAEARARSAERQMQLFSIPNAKGVIKKISRPTSNQIVNVKKVTSPRKSIARKISLSEGQILKKQKALSELKRNILTKAQNMQKLKNKGVFDELQEKVLEKKRRSLSKLLKERQASEEHANKLKNKKVLSELLKKVPKMRSASGSYFSVGSIQKKTSPRPTSTNYLRIGTGTSTLQQRKLNSINARIQAKHERMKRLAEEIEDIPYLEYVLKELEKREQAILEAEEKAKKKNKEAKFAHLENKTKKYQSDQSNEVPEWQRIKLKRTERNVHTMVIPEGSFQGNANTAKAPPPILNYKDWLLQKGQITKYKNENMKLLKKLFGNETTFDEEQIQFLRDHPDFVHQLEKDFEKNQRLFEYNPIKDRDLKVAEPEIKAKPKLVKKLGKPSETTLLRNLKSLLPDGKPNLNKLSPINTYQDLQKLDQFMEKTLERLPKALQNKLLALPVPIQAQLLELPEQLQERFLELPKAERDDYLKLTQKMLKVEKTRLNIVKNDLLKYKKIMDPGIKQGLMENYYDYFKKVLDREAINRKTMAEKYDKYNTSERNRSSYKRFHDAQSLENVLNDPSKYKVKHLRKPIKSKSLSSSKSSTYLKKNDPYAYLILKNPNINPSVIKVVGLGGDKVVRDFPVNKELMKQINPVIKMLFEKLGRQPTPKEISDAILAERLGREPTSQEIRKNIGLKQKDISEILRNDQLGITGDIYDNPQYLFILIRKAWRDLKKELTRNPTIDEIADKIGQKEKVSLIKKIINEKYELL